MPPGMCPVIEVPVGSKSTIVPITPEQTAKLCSNAGGALDPTTIVSTLSSCQSAVRQGYAKKKSTQKSTKSQRLKHHQIQQEQEQAQQPSQPQPSHQNPERDSNHSAKHHLNDTRQELKHQQFQKKHLGEQSNLSKTIKRENELTNSHESSSLSSKMMKKEEPRLVDQKPISRMIMEDEVKSIEEETDITMMETEGSDSGTASGRRSRKKVDCEDSKDTMTTTTTTKDSGSDESCSSVSDPCDQYITDEGSDDTTNDEMELELKLKQTLDGNCSDDGGDVEIPDAVEVGDTNDFLAPPSNRMTKEPVVTTKAVDVDDDLEDLDRLDDGDLALAPFANPTESWLLPDSSTETLI